MNKGIIAFAIVGAAFFGYNIANTTVESSKRTNIPVSVCEQKILQARELALKRTSIFGNDMNIYVDGQKAGEIITDLSPTNVRYDIFAGDHEKRIGHSANHLSITGVHTEVYDSEGNKIGSLDQHLRLLSETVIADKQGRPAFLATSPTLTTAMNVTSLDGGKNYGQSSRTGPLSYAVTTDPATLDTRLVLSLVEIEDYLVGINSTH